MRTLALVAGVFLIIACSEDNPSVTTDAGFDAGPPDYAFAFAGQYEGTGHQVLTDLQDGGVTTVDYVVDSVVITHLSLNEIVVRPYGLNHLPPNPDVNPNPAFIARTSDAGTFSQEWGIVWHYSAGEGSVAASFYPASGTLDGGTLTVQVPGLVSGMSSFGGGGSGDTYRWQYSYTFTGTRTGP